MLTETITRIGKQIADLMPDSAQEAGQEIEKNIRNALHSVLAQLDLVSREEFDAQATALKHTQEKLAQMEKQIEALEKTSQPKPRATRTRKAVNAGKKSAAPKSKDS